MTCSLGPHSPRVQLTPRELPFLDPAWIRLINTMPYQRILSAFSLSFQAINPLLYSVNSIEQTFPAIMVPDVQAGLPLRLFRMLGEMVICAKDSIATIQ